MHDVRSCLLFKSKISPERTGELERTYESEMLRALDADNQGTSSFISPQTFYGDGV